MISLKEGDEKREKERMKIKAKFKELSYTLLIIHQSYCN